MFALSFALAFSFALASLVARTQLSVFRNKGEFRSVEILELVTPILDIGMLTVQMLGFPFGEDMPWSEEVEPVQ